MSDLVHHRQFRRLRRRGSMIHFVVVICGIASFRALFWMVSINSSNTNIDFSDSEILQLPSRNQHAIRKTASSSSDSTNSISELVYDYDAEIVNDDRCRSILDALDASFDRRQEMRHAYQKLQQQQLNGTLPHKKQLYDVYEPDSVCLTDERFGKTSTSTKKKNNNNDNNNNVEEEQAATRYQAYGDGPKFVCGIDMIARNAKKNNNINNSCLIYSVGSNNQIDFEQSVHDHLPDCEVHTFDPTLKVPFIGGAYSTFHPWGLGVDNSIDGTSTTTMQTYSLATIQSKLGHTGRTIDILKMDCDMCEFDVMPPVFEDVRAGKLQIDQIQIELHSLNMKIPMKIKMDQVRNVFDAADKANMRIFHKERNQWGCRGFKCVEFAWASKDFLRRANAQILCGRKEKT